MSNVVTARTNKQVLNSLKPPVARFYPCDLHVHSLGSFDVWQSGRLENLPDELRRMMAEVGDGAQLRLPLSKEPSDAGDFDKRITQPSLVAAFYDSLLQRRTQVAQAGGAADSDNWAIVGITDHNTAHFSTALSQLAWDRRGADRLVVLPGIELEVVFPFPGTSAECHVHILCLFAPCTEASDIRIAIHDSGPDSHSWNFGQQLRTSELAACIDRLRSHPAYPSICIAAHVWSSKGMENEPKKLRFAYLDAEIARLQGEMLRAETGNSVAEIQDIERRISSLTSQRDDAEEIHLEVLRLIGTCGFDALQVRDQTHEGHYRRLHRFLVSKGRAVPIVSSDAHSPSAVFSCGTGVPYAKVSSVVLNQSNPAAVFDELRSRVLRFGETRMTYASPGRVSHWIAGIEIVRDASNSSTFWSYSLPSKNGPDNNISFTLALSRNLNCFVGGRGSGKSAGIEAISFLTEKHLFEQQAREKDKTDWYSRAAATLSGCRIRLFWKSTGSAGIGSLPKKTIAVSRYFDPDGRHQPAQMRDIDDKAIVDDGVQLPQIRVLRAHEIEETARPDHLRRLFDDLCGTRILELEKVVLLHRRALKAQRGKILSVCERLARLTASAGPLRQFGIRKMQFETVDKPDLRARFEEVDKATLASKSAIKIEESWITLATRAKLHEIRKDVTQFFDKGASDLSNDDGSPRDGHSILQALLNESTGGKAQGHRENVLSSLSDARLAATNFEAAVQAQSAILAQVLREFHDELERKGLPSGSSDRDSKKRSFEKAMEDYNDYSVDLRDLERLIEERTNLHEALESACEERTLLRKKQAEQLNEQLARDLDGSVLRIVVDAKPLADRQEFDRWLESNFDPVFQKYKSHRRAAWIKSELMPKTVRDLMLNGEAPDPRVLRVPVQTRPTGELVMKTAKGCSHLAGGASVSR